MREGEVCQDETEVDLLGLTFSLLYLGKRRPSTSIVLPSAPPYRRDRFSRSKINLPYSCLLHES